MAGYSPYGLVGLPGHKAVFGNVASRGGMWIVTKGVVLDPTQEFAAAAAIDPQLYLRPGNVYSCIQCASHTERLVVPKDGQIFYPLTEEECTYYKKRLLERGLFWRR